jgi:hypothetical protein
MKLLLLLLSPAVLTSATVFRHLDQGRRRAEPVVFASRATDLNFNGTQDIKADNKRVSPIFDVTSTPGEITQGSHCPTGSSSFNSVCVKLVDHGGSVVPRVHIQPIFWGNKWSNPAYVQDKVTGMMEFYNGLVGSTYINLANMYLRGSLANLSVSANYIQDNSNSEKVFTVANRYATIVGNKVCSLIGAGYRDPTHQNYFPVHVGASVLCCRCLAAGPLPRSELTPAARRLHRDRGRVLRLAHVDALREQRPGDPLRAAV